MPTTPVPNNYYPSLSDLMKPEDLPSCAKSPDFEPYFKKEVSIKMNMIIVRNKKCFKVAQRSSRQAHFSPSLSQNRT